VSVYSSVENESYQYDANGNRNAGTVNGVTQTYTYSPTSNQLIGISGGTSTQYGYDVNGNTALINGASSYQYDPYIRLDAAGGAADYVNPEGQRLRKAGGLTGTTYFAPATGGALMAENDNGTWVDYVRLNGRISAGQISAIHADQVGRPEVVTDASQNVVWLAQNFPFTQKVTTANITLNLGFPGQYYDPERQTWNNGYRDYVSSEGRYLESDPSGLEGGINTYAYVNNNPLSGIDPLGLCDREKCTAARAALAALGQQLSSYGSTATWTGVGLVGASGIAGILAPEGAPAEIGGAEIGVGLIDSGGVLSTLGGTLTGYAHAGFTGAGKAFIRSTLTDHAGSFGLNHVFNGVASSTLNAANAIIGQIPDALAEEEAACANN
jgi:RHS repeat-associated protein